ncbi:MAG: dienelactone hydrolase family protein [Proteobacteria bacterium]|nr:dienelactone hydrolase family protein [Pseudomonadota bacterium]
MGKTIQLTAGDGHGLDAYQADPDGAPKGAIVIIQEIFGVNSHIRSVCDGYAADGYVAIAPALFDRVERGIELGYVEPDMSRGRETRGKLSWDGALADVSAAADAVEAAGKVAVVGYCYGGSVAWLAATRLDFAAVVSYYGGNVAEFAEEQPKCPVILHIGDQDKAIDAGKIETIKNAQPDIPLYIYEGAGHGFNCEQRGSYDEEATKVARGRTLAFLAEHIG